MNNLVLSMCVVGPEGSTHIGEVEFEPIFDLPRGKAWHRTFKMGDNTIGVYAHSLDDNAPVLNEYTLIKKENVP